MRFGETTGVKPCCHFSSNARISKSSNKFVEKLNGQVEVTQLL